MRRPRAKRYATLADAKKQVTEAQRRWFEEAFGKPIPPHALVLLGPTKGREIAGNKLVVEEEREARRLYDDLWAAMRAANEWCAKHPDGGGPCALQLRQLVPPKDGGRSGPWPSLRGSVARLDSSPLTRPSDGFPPVRSGLEWIVEQLDQINLLDLPDRDHHSRFLSDTEMAKVVIGCGHWPAHSVRTDVGEITEGQIVSILARDIRDIRKRAGALKTFDDKARMGVAPKRGPKPRR